MSLWNKQWGRGIVAAAGIMGLLAVGPITGLRAQEAESAMVTAQEAPAGAMWVETLDLSNLTQDYGEPHAGRSVDNAPLTLSGVVYPHGIGTHAGSEFRIGLKGAATRFVSMVGLDDERKGSGSVVFEVWVDGKKVAETGVLHGGDAPKLISVPLTGAKILTLRVTDGGDGIANDHADWAGALLMLAPGATDKPASLGVPLEPPRMVIPPPDPKPAIHGASITGATPGHAFLYRIAATGEGPLTFQAHGLPKGLTLDAGTGIISGTLAAAGETKVRLTVRGAQGSSSRTLTIVGGDHKLALTPPMGWNSWNCWAGAVDAAKVRAAADMMVQSGLAAHGFQYINIDDTWEAGRSPSGEILSNEKFPDMKALAAYVHGQGLKLGIYSSPGPTTCAGFTASYQHEAQDAKTYAQWGIDYLKYDWCSYGDVATGAGLDRLKKPYSTMRQALDQADRDIVYSLCQYGMGDVWEWGQEVGGNCWRTTGDINDSWSSLHDIYTHQDGHEKYAGPGHWNDPDMLVVGKVGWGPSLHPSHLKPNEQILHITMWCLLSSPLLIGCDMSQMDPFTVALLSNDEALEINQDSLGRPAGRVALDDVKEVWARKLADGTMAVGLINAGTETTPVTAHWKDLGLKGSQPVRDLWLHKDQGAFKDQVTFDVPAHGAVLLKIGKPK
jgi:alpha-galactosidase